MKRNCRGVLLCLSFLLLSACTHPPATGESPPPEPTAAETPALTPGPTLTPEPTPTPEPVPEPVSLPPMPVEDYEACHLDAIGATLLLPKDWSGNYEVDDGSWESYGYICLAQKDYPAGELGEPSDGNMVLTRVVAMPTAEFEERHLLGMTTQEWRDGLSQGEDVPRLWTWLGQRDGVTYATWAQTSFQAAVHDEEKAALYFAMSAEIDNYPPDSSAYFIFDTP